MKRLVIAALLALAAIPAHAETERYLCIGSNVRGSNSTDMQAHIATVDDVKHTLSFMGKVYRNFKSNQECDAHTCYTNEPGDITLTLSNQGSGDLIFGNRSKHEIVAYLCAYRP